jgi:hypothetical protein
MTPQEKQVLEKKICCACKKDKEIKNFHRNKIRPDGYENKCKTCKLNGGKCRRGRTTIKTIYKASDRRGMILVNVSKEDWVLTYKFLEMLGYSLNRNIHEQFCERHSLNTRKRMKEKSAYYSPKDLDMI